MEILFGKIYNPRFNFDNFGNGGCKGHTEESRKKISEALSGENHPMYGKYHSEETKQKMSESVSRVKNTSSYFRVCKQKDKCCKQGFIWKYRYYEGGKRKSLSATTIDKLESKVKEKGLKWLKLKED